MSDAYLPVLILLTFITIPAFVSGFPTKKGMDWERSAKSSIIISIVLFLMLLITQNQLAQCRRECHDPVS